MMPILITCAFFIAIAAFALIAQLLLLFFDTEMEGARDAAVPREDLFDPLLGEERFETPN